MLTAFDPFAPLERRLGADLAHRLVGLACAAPCLWLVASRLASFRAQHSKLLWLAETALFAGFAAGFLLRSRPVARARGAAEWLLPCLGAALPMALAHWPAGLGEWLAGDRSGPLVAVTPLHPAVAAAPAGRLARIVLIAGGDLLACAGLLSLGRSFSLTPEARELRTSGLYRWMRHPVYAGELAAAAGIALSRFCPRNAVLFALFAGVQLWRARREERRLEEAFPAYADYRRRTRSFLPGV